MEEIASVKYGYDINFIKYAIEELNNVIFKYLNNKNKKFIRPIKPKRITLKTKELILKRCLFAKGFDENKGFHYFSFLKFLRYQLKNYKKDENELSEIVLNVIPIFENIKINGSDINNCFNGDIFVELKSQEYAQKFKKCIFCNYDNYNDIITVIKMKKNKNKNDNKILKISNISSSIFKQATITSLIQSWLNTNIFNDKCIVVSKKTRFKIIKICARNVKNAI